MSDFGQPEEAGYVEPVTEPRTRELSAGGATPAGSVPKRGTRYRQQARRPISTVGKTMADVTLASCVIAGDLLLSCRRLCVDQAFYKQ